MRRCPGSIWTSRSPRSRDRSARRCPPLPTCLRMGGRSQGPPPRPAVFAASRVLFSTLRFLLAVLGALAADVMVPRPIAAETEPTPDQILAEVAGYSGRTVDRVRLRGVKAHDGDDVKAAIHHQDASFWPWSKGTVFMPREFVYDVRRVVLFYEESGFPDARVRGRAVPEGDEEVDLELTVNEGQPTLVTGIEILDWPFTKPSVPDLIKDLPQAVGKPCDRSEVEKSRELIRQRLVEKSHWKAVVHDTILVADYRARVQFRVEP